jgi:hypothetical protein
VVLLSDCGRSSRRSRGGRPTRLRHARHRACRTPLCWTPLGPGPRVRPVPNVGGQSSGPGLHDAGVGDQVSLEERVCLGEVTDTGRAIADGRRRLDDRPEDGFTGLLTETLIDHPNDATFIRGTARATASGGSRFRREPDVEPRRPPGPGSPQPATTVERGLDRSQPLARAGHRYDKARPQLPRALTLAAILTWLPDPADAS